MIFIGIADIIHRTADEKDTKSTNGAFIPLQSGIRIFMLQGVERYATILETDHDTIIFLDIHIQKAIGTIWIGIRRHINDNFFAS